MKGMQGRPKTISAEQQYEPCKKFNISMPADLYLKLNDYSEKTERTKSWIIKKAVEEWLEKNS